MITSEQLLKLSVEELRELNQRVVNAIKIKSELQGQDIAFKLKVGQIVKLNTTRQGINPNEKWKVEKINRAKAVLKRERDGICWNIPFNIIMV